MWKVLPLGSLSAGSFCHATMHTGGGGMVQAVYFRKAPVLRPHPTLSLSWRSMLLCNFRPAECTH